MTERQEPYITTTATQTDYLRDAEVVVLSKREREFIEVWRHDPSKKPVFVEPHMENLWSKLCRLYSQARKHDIEPVVVVDMMRLDAYTLNDVE